MRTPLVSMVAMVSASALLATGCASGASATPAAGLTTSSRSSLGSRTVRFIGYSKNSDGPGFTVILTGAVGDYGPAVTVHPDGTVDPEHSDLKLELSKGSFVVDIGALDKKLVAVTSRWAATSNCSFYAKAAAATPVVAGSGTGSYRDITGSISMTLTIDEVDTKPCPGGTSKFISQLIVLAGSGTVSVGSAGKSGE